MGSYCLRVSGRGVMGEDRGRIKGMQLLIEMCCLLASFAIIIPCCHSQGPGVRHSLAAVPMWVAIAQKQCVYISG